MISSEKKRLLVEGQTDLYAIAELMGKHVEWGKDKKDRPIHIEVCGSNDEMLAPNFIPTKLKSREVEILAIVIDADDDAVNRWSRIRNLCVGEFPGIPTELPEAGLVYENHYGKRLGVWVMPNNSSAGMLETFFRFLVKEPDEPIWDFAQKSVSQAMSVGAKCKKVHQDKANIYTWLAWQDPPDLDMGGAIIQNILNARSEQAEPFVSWFCDVFQLARLPSAD